MTKVGDPGIQATHIKEVKHDGDDRADWPNRLLLQDLELQEPQEMYSIGLVFPRL